MLALFRTNFLVIQHLETLYLRGNHVRVVCERVWKKAQECTLNKASQLDLVTCKLPNEAYVWSMHRSWRVTPARTLQDKTSSLAKQLARDSNSRLNQVTRPSCQTILFVTNLTFHILNTHQYKHPLYLRIVQSF